MSARRGEPGPAAPAGPSGEQKVSFYPAWCKRCGNCVAFCPREALAKDQWGYPYLANPDRCTTCGLCEMLCPDFAISVGVGEQPPARESAAAPAATGRPGPPLGPERLAPEPASEDGGEGNGQGSGHD